MAKLLKLLIVEDYESDAELILRELKEGGYNPVYQRVENAADFQAALFRENWDIILSDHSLPRFSSESALKLLAQSQLDIPFIIISGVMGEEAAVEALKSGADDYLVKGKLARLIPAVERELREAEERRERRRAEKALAESERKYRQIIETSMEGIWVINARNKTTFANEQMAGMLGTSVERMLGQDLSEFMDGNAWLEAERNLACGKTGESAQYDFRFLKADGSVLWAGISTSPIFDEQGQYQGAVAMVTDITNRKRAEEAVRESEERFRTMADAAPVMIATLNAQGQLEYVNKASQNLLGLSLDDFVENRWLSFIHPDDQQKVVGEIQWATLEQVETRLEFRVRNKQGQCRWVYAVLSPRFTASGEFAGLISCNLDITERKQAEEALARSLEKEKMISRIVEFNSQSFSVQDVLNYTAKELGSFLDVDRCLVIQYPNNALEPGQAARLLGSYRKKSWIADVKEPDMPHVDFTNLYLEKNFNYRLCLDIPDTSIEAPVEFSAYFKRYQIRSILMHEVSYRGIVYGRICLHNCSQAHEWSQEEREMVENIIRHLGDTLYQLDLYQREREARHRLEESYSLLEVYTRKVEQSNLELENFATIASHDLQAPLRKIMTFGDMLAHSAGDKLPPDGRDYLERMKKAAQRMQTLITDLLDLSRVNRKGKPFRKTDLREVARLAIEDLSEMAQARNAEIVLDVQGTLLDADQDQLRQVLVNLIENGIKFSHPATSPRIKICSQVHNGQDGQLCSLHVQDNGIGIQPEHFDRIFEVFTRLHGQDAYPGTGIGLSLVKKIVERHHGEVVVSSAPGQGSDFVVQLPIHQDSEAV